MHKLREELVRKDQWYKFYRHYVEASDVVADRYAHEDGRDVLYLKGFNEEKRVVLAKGFKERSDQYTSLCDWVKGQEAAEKDSRMTSELWAAESYADSMGISFDKQPEELVKSMLSAMRQIADKHDIDLDDMFQENRFSL